MIRVVSVQGLALLQDGGRPGRMHEGVPPGGALVPELLAAANAAIGNAPGCAAVEHYGRIELDGSETVGTPGGPIQLEGARGFAPAQRVGYVALAGGIDAPVVLGGRGALLVAGVGRPLRAGDTLVGLGHGVGAGGGVGVGGGLGAGPIRVIPGPDLERLAPDALDTLLAAVYTVTPVGDRAGIRLAGPRLGVRIVAGPSAPMVRGAIQVPPSGELIVLGPDHPTTGGYPVVAVVCRADQGRFAALRPGATLTFTRTEPGWSR